LSKANFDQVFSALDYYVSLYISKYIKNPRINRLKEKWPMKNLIEDFDYDVVISVIDYYFKLPRDNHSIYWFYNNFGDMLKYMCDEEIDKKIREERRKKTLELIKEMEQHNANG
jgi:hypothetical protein